MLSFFAAQVRQAASCLHETPFAGRKNMEHGCAECSCARIEQGFCPYSIKTSPASGIMLA